MMFEKKLLGTWKLFGFLFGRQVGFIKNGMPVVDAAYRHKTYLNLSSRFFQSIFA